MSGHADIRTEVENRCYHLLMGQQTMAKTAATEAADNATPVVEKKSKEGRRLLDVEKIARRDKELNARSRENYLESVRDAVHDEVCDRIQRQIADVSGLCRNVMSIDAGLAQVYDILSVKAASIARLEPVVAEIPWLAKELIDLANSPKYRKTDRLGKVIKFETLRMALSYFGLENLKLLIPNITLLRWVPKVTDPYPAFKHKIHEQVLATALSSRTIAEFSKVDPFHAYLLGAYHELGKLAITKLFFKYFDTVRDEALIEAHNNQERDEHQALTEVTPDPDVWLAMMWNHSFDLSAKMIENMQMRRVMIAGAMREMADDVPVIEMSSLARILAQGRAYGCYRVLSQYKMIAIDEAKAFLRNTRMPKVAIAELKHLDVKQITMSFSEES